MSDHGAFFVLGSDIAVSSEPVHLFQALTSRINEKQNPSTNIDWQKRKY